MSISSIYEKLYEGLILRNNFLCKAEYYSGSLMELIIFSGIFSVKVKLYSQRVLLVTASTKTTAILETKTGHHTDRP